MECSFSPESVFLLKPCGTFAPVYILTFIFSLHICTYIFKDLRTWPFTEFLCPGSFTHLYFLSERARPVECLLANGKMLVELEKLHFIYILAIDNGVQKPTVLQDLGKFFLFIFRYHIFYKKK